MGLADQSDKTPKTYCCKEYKLKPVISIRAHPERGICGMTDVWNEYLTRMDQISLSCRAILNASSLELTSSLL